jgi:hypothetical protein
MKGILYFTEHKHAPMDTDPDHTEHVTLMHQRAQDLTLLLNKLAWPEIRGPYFPRGTARHVVQGSDYSVAINYNTVMFTCRDTLRFKFVDLPADDGNVDIVAWVATEFLHWVTTLENQ